jgi:hypothetical protein
MDKLDLKILKAINTLSQTSFISPIAVSDIIKIDKKDLGDRLMVPKKSGHIDIITREFISSMTLPNFVAKVKLTDLGRKGLK